MKRLATLPLAAALCATGLAAAAAEADPNAALRLYDGKWIATADKDGKTTSIENHCARTGLFFACEQVVNGKTGALVVFLPQEKTAAGQIYRTQALRADGAEPGPWNRLTIDGDRWVYAGPVEDKEHPLHNRTLTRFFGPDRIRFEIQSSPDGQAWTTTMSGEERRVR